MSAFVLFEAADQTFALPAGAVVQVLRMAATAPVPGAPAFLRGVLNLHGTLVPVIDVRVRLGCAPRPPRREDQLLLARAGERLVALEVERVRDVVELPGGEDPAAIGAAAPLVAGGLALPGGAVVVHALEAWLALGDAAAVAAP